MSRAHAQHLERRGDGRLLAAYFHIEEDVVRRGFRNVDGATLSFYTDDELSQAGSRTPLCDDGCSSS